ncbi:MAG: NAD(P)-dependent oxidoreductase, partial [Roseiflexaceae bacterium]
MTQPTVGFIGLGIMGSGMARNIARAGFPLYVYNRTASRMHELADVAAQPTTSPADLASKCDIVITCVSDTPDVEAVIGGADGVLAGLRPGTLVIDMSTISPQSTVALAAAIAARGGRMLDAPVSGGSEGAAKGTLSIMVGGTETDFNRALPVFQAMGKNVIHVGAQGAG